MITIANPYDPPRSIDDGPRRLSVEDSLIVPYRIDPLTLAAIISSVMNAVAICLYYSSGTGGIGDPILAPLAATSMLWIPVYRLAVPALIPMMPQVCRQLFAIVYLSSGVAFSVNDFAGHFFGKWIFVSTLGLLSTAAICFVLGLVGFGICVIRSGNAARSFANTVVWIAIAVLLNGIFYAIGHLV